MRLSELLADVGYVDYVGYVGCTPVEVGRAEARPSNLFHLSSKIKDARTCVPASFTYTYTYVYTHIFIIIYLYIFINIYTSIHTIHTVHESEKGVKTQRKTTETHTSGKFRRLRSTQRYTQVYISHDRRKEIKSNWCRNAVCQVTPWGVKGQRSQWFRDGDDKTLAGSLHVSMQ